MSDQYVKLEEERRQKDRADKKKKEKKKRKEKGGRRGKRDSGPESEEDITPAHMVDIVTEEMPEVGGPPLGTWVHCGRTLIQGQGLALRQALWLTLCWHPFCSRLEFA